jgi:hypothetical protein
MTKLQSIFLFVCVIGLTSTATAAPTKPTYFSAKGVAPDQINLIWLGSTTTTGTVASYTIRRNGTVVGTVAHTPYQAPYHDTEQQLFQDFNLSPGTYTYTVTARDSAGADSAPSDPVSAQTTPGTPALLPADRLASWIPGVTVGVPGGIPTNRTRKIDVTQPPYNADKTGANDASVAINNAIAAASAEDIVYLPSGTYKILNAIYLAFKGNITIRGAGMNNTVIDCRAGACLVVRGSEYYNSYTLPVLSGATRGSTQLTFADASSLVAGNQFKIERTNDTSLPELSVGGFQGIRSQNLYITGKSGNTVTFQPPLIMDFTSSRTWVELPAYNLPKFVGIEDLTVDGSNALPQSGIGLSGTYGSWVKNVKVKGIGNYSLSLGGNIFCEVRHCFLDELNHSGTNGAGLLMGASTGCLVEVNTVIKSFPLFEINASSVGNVFGYNYLPDGSVNTNHGPHNSFNLYEGNFLNAGEFKSDGYFGGDSEETFFRNWTSGFLAAKRFSRNFNSVGNVIRWVSLGQPNIGNGNSDGYALPSKGIYWQDWSATTGLGIKGTLTTRTSDTAGVFSITSGDSRLLDYCSVFGGGNCMSISVDWGAATRYGMSQSSRSGNQITLTGGYGAVLPAAGTSIGIWPRSEGFQELDMDVALTLIRKANSTPNGAIPANEALPVGQALPSSLYLSTKPSWFGTLNWPPVNPATPNATTADSIPAGYRFNHPGQEAPGIGSTTNCTAFTYTPWGSCNNGQQTRWVTGATPDGCTGGNPVTTQSCSNVSPGAPMGLKIQ